MMTMMQAFSSVAADTTGIPYDQPSTADILISINVD